MLSYISYIANTPGLHSISLNILGLNLSGLTLIKIFFVFFLFTLTVFLAFYNPRPTPGVVESSFFNKTIKNILLYGSAAATFFGTGLAVKSEIYSGKLEALEKELATQRGLLNQSIDNLTKIQNEMKLLSEKHYYTKLISSNLESKYNAVKDRIPKLLEDARRLRADLDNPDKEASDKVSGILDFKQSSHAFTLDLRALNSLAENLEEYQAIASGSVTANSDPISALPSIPSSCPSPSPERPSTPHSSEIKKDEIKVDDVNLKNSSIINWDWFESLTSWEKLAVSLLLTKSIIFSALLGLVFNYYGDFLLTRFKIESRFPKLATIIKIRRSFTRYYFILDCCIIMGVIILECIFSLFILKISLF